MAPPHPLLAALAERKLLRQPPPQDAEGLPRRGEPEAVALLKLCHARLLEGGLSVALDVRPDELFGPLVAQMGGAARTVRVVDVRERPALELTVSFREHTERWEVEGLEGLVHNLNSLLAEEREVRAVAVLGEWEDALQLWCVPRAQLGWALRGPLAGAHNSRELAKLVR
ncbi:MAG: hypothetical protein L0Y66_26115 [Myxococcaceae bacterium]|nr:hypothetical protein [Myxococcaceae bacterium]MCI0671167.1 hypothetical protein [Myxococcaceae bacterium]